MGKEIEMKVPVSENEFQRLLDFASKTKSGVEHYLKKDEYYSRYDSDEERKTKGEPKVIRIRTEKSDEEEKHFFPHRNQLYSSRSAALPLNDAGRFSKKAVMPSL